MFKLSRAHNKLLKHLLIIIPLLSGLGIAAAVVFDSSGFVTREGHYIEQPIPFSHETHGKQVGLDCTFCHAQVEKNSHAGMPTAQTCYGCHQDILKDSPYLAPVKKAVQKNQPIHWVRVHRLPDHVYFNHGKHIKANVACTSCHGNVEEKPLMNKEHHFSMQYCLDCHRGEQQAKLQDCYTCHR